MSENQQDTIISAVGNLKDEHIEIARRHLRVGQCFSTLARFEVMVSKAPGLDILSCWVWTTKKRGVVASGQMIVRLSGIADPVEIGRWSVKWDGVADVYIGAAEFIGQAADELDRSLNAAWRNGTITAAIRAARQSVG